MNRQAGKRGRAEWNKSWGDTRKPIHSHVPIVLIVLLLIIRLLLLPPSPLLPDHAPLVVVLDLPKYLAVAACV